MDHDSGFNIGLHKKLLAQPVQMSLYDEYAVYCNNHREKYGADSMVLIEVGSFIEFYDCDRHLGADMGRICTILNIQATRKNKNTIEISRSNPAMAGFPRNALEKYIPLLMDAGMTVAMVMQAS